LAACPPEVLERFDFDITRGAGNASLSPFSRDLKTNDCFSVDDDDHQIFGLTRGVSDDMEDGSTGKNAIDNLEQTSIAASKVVGLYASETNVRYIISVM
jgi:hypothetical protein